MAALGLYFGQDGLFLRVESTLSHEKHQSDSLSAAHDSI
jgi:hypothetical protein